MMIQSLYDVYKLVKEYPDREYIIIFAEEWERVRKEVDRKQVVQATNDFPAFFWYYDKKIVTPQYMVNLDASRERV